MIISLTTIGQGHSWTWVLHVHDHLKRRPEKKVKSRVSSLPHTIGPTRDSSSQKHRVPNFLQDLCELGLVLAHQRPSLSDHGEEGGWVPGIVGKNDRTRHVLEDRGLALEVLDFLLRRGDDGFLLKAQRPRKQGGGDRLHAFELAQGDDEEAAVGVARLRDLLGFHLHREPVAVRLPYLVVPLFGPGRLKVDRLLGVMAPGALVVAVVVLVVVGEGGLGQLRTRSAPCPRG